MMLIRSHRQCPDIAETADDDKIIAVNIYRRVMPRFLGR